MIALAPCYLIREGALQHAVPGDLTHVAGAELEDLSCDGVLLHQGLLWTQRPHSHSLCSNLSCIQVVDVYSLVPF